jgi:hypothetical protein
LIDDDMSGRPGATFIKNDSNSPVIDEDMDEEFAEQIEKDMMATSSMY